jgi:trigger factor
MELCSLAWVGYILWEDLIIMESFMENVNVVFEDINKTSKKLMVEVPYSSVKAEMEKAVERLSKTAAIKGFRKGKVPKNVIEKQYASDIRNDVAEHLVNESYAYIIKKHNLDPVSYPNISDVVLKDNEALKYQAIVELKPVFEPKGYLDMKLEEIRVEPTEEEIEKVAMSFLETKAEMKDLPADRPAVDGDWVNIDLEGEIDGIKKENLSAKSYLCQVGENTSVMEEISKGLKGMKPGDEKNISIKYDNDYHVEDLKGKEVNFKVKLNKTMEKIIPELTDELVKEAKFAESKDVFLENIKTNIKMRKEDARWSDLRHQTMQILLDENKFDVSNAEIERKLPEVRERAIRNIFGPQANKMPEKQIHEVLAKHESDIKKAAEDEVRLFYILESIAKKENISADKAEIEKELALASQAMKMSTDELKKKYGAENIENAMTNSIIERKTFNYLYDKAKITPRKETK